MDQKERGEYLKERNRLARAGKLATRGSGKISEEFLRLPRPEDPEGLLLKSLIEDRRQGR